MPFAKTKFWLLLLATLTALLFLGNLATNLLSSDIQDSLRAFWGQNYQRNLWIVCIVLATIAAFVSLKSKENPQSIAHTPNSDKKVLPQSHQELNFADKENTVIQGDIHIENGNFIGRDQVTNNYYEKEMGKDKSDYRNAPLPVDIINAVDNSLPYDQETKEKNYIGLKVKWELNLQSIRQTSEKDVVTIIFMNHNPIWAVFAKASVGKYPILKILKEGHPITVRGEITNVRSSFIYLMADGLDIG